MRPLTVMAWDTATPWCVVGLEHFEADGSVRTLGRFVDSESGTHSQILPFRVAELLKEAGLKPGDIDLLAVGRGPGSFTGLRTGLALAKGLAMGADIPLLGLPTLAVVASAALRAHRGGNNSNFPLLAPLIDARHKQIFTGLYDENPDDLDALPLELIPPTPVAPLDLPRFLLDSAGGREVLLAGPALALAEEYFPNGLPGLLAASYKLSPPDVFELARLARFLLLSDEKALEKYPPIPMYIRQPDIRKSGIAMR